MAIMLVMPCDTSECERIFSLMNDLKTAERSSLNQTNLRNLMMWYKEARHASSRRQRCPFKRSSPNFGAWPESKAVRARHPHGPRGGAGGAGGCRDSL